MEAKELPVVAEFREMNAAMGVDEKYLVEKWLTPEFWTMAVAVVTNVLTVGVLLGFVNASDVQELSKSLTGIITATEVVVVNALLVWKYLSGRQQLRSQMLASRYRMIEAVTVERMRLASTQK